MAVSRNRSFRSLFTGFETTLRDLFLKQPKAYFADIRSKLSDLSRTNFDLGCRFAAMGKWQDAVFRFRVALYFQPKFAAAQYNLGCCLLQLKQRAKARVAFIRALQIQPNYPEALFMLSAVDPNAVPPSQRPQRMPVEMVQPFFSGLAAQYDAIEAQNQYQGGRIAYDAAKQQMKEMKDLVVVDLGCGTGIASRPWRPVAKEIVGVDFAGPMADAARLVKVADAPLFNRVLEEDITDLTQSVAPLAEADMVMLVNVAQFIGNLSPLLKSLGAKLKQGALVALSIEPCTVAGGYGVNVETIRFGHQADYVKQVAAEAGFEVKQETRANLYPNYNATLFVLGKI